MIQSMLRRVSSGADPVYMILWAIFAYALFWGGNLFVLVVLGFGFGPLVFVEVLEAIWMGVVPAQFGLFLVAVYGVPILSCALALTRPIRGQPTSLMLLLYGFELPLMLLLLLRVFAIHELVFSNAFLLMVGVFGAIALLRSLFRGPTESSGAWSVFRVLASAGTLLLGVGAALVTALFLLPFMAYVFLAIPAGIVGLFEAMTAPQSASEFAFLPVVLVFAFGFCWLLVMLFGVPYGFAATTVHTWWTAHTSAVRRFGRARAWVLSGGAILTVAVMTGVLARQPQVGVFAALEDVKSDADRLAIMDQEPWIRRGLLNARLSGERYLEVDPHGEGVADLWDEFVGETLAQGPAAFYRFLVWPMAYHAIDPGFVRIGRQGRGSSGRMPKDVQTASTHYAEVFDGGITRLEREALLASVTNTWSWRTVEAGLFSVGEQRVRLAAQGIEVEIIGDVARVRVHDEWRNRGWQREEILLSFALPESAAVTGLWMGPDPEKEKAFAYTVAPRGAAQEVYESEVQRRVDPALLEQVGPRQYRLRAFPIEPRRDSDFDHGVSAFHAEGPPMHIWLEMVVPIENGQVALPALSEVRNAYWDGTEARTVDGVAAASDTWMPRVEATGAKARHEVVSHGMRIVAEPDSGIRGSVPSMDVVIDASASMRLHRDALAATLAGLGLGARVWCVREQALVLCPDFDAQTALFWGNRSAAEHVALWMKQGRDASALVVLTDSGSPELMSQVERTLPEGQLPPLWFVHHGGLPSAYADWTLDRLQRPRSGVVTSAEALLDRMSEPFLVDGWRFSVTPDEGEETAPGAFDSIAARAAIRWLSHEGGSVSVLDKQHALAVENHVVTPYSSMIVVVNTRQRELLERLSEEEDRFERESIDGEEFMAAHSAVPEPGMWVLLVLGGCLLLGTRRARQRNA